MFRIQIRNQISKFETSIGIVHNIAAFNIPILYLIFHYSDVQFADIPMETFKRSMSSSGSRRVRGDPFAFGLGKRADPFAFGLGRRKRFYWKYNPFNFLKEEGAKRDPYAFGLGK